MSTTDDPRLEAARRALETALEAGDPAPPLAELAEIAGLSAWHFQRRFSACYGLSPKRYALARRTRILADGLARGRDVEGAVAEAGFGSSSRVYGRAGMLGMTPGRLRRGGAGETVRHALGRTRLGLMLLAATDAGVCSVEFGDRPDELLEGLRRRFPKAVIEPGGEREIMLLEAVVRAVEDGTGAESLPLDLRGTAFQLEVWRALRDIRPGERLSYSELAARLGRPGSARAVARACASNPAAVAVPCHRVVGVDGSLTGYRWGLTRKKALLEKEQKTEETAAVPEPESSI
ncbi:methylated-DNA--[protein]-cysteine S-methyltransferase [Desulfovibrio aminophilus]|uniref:methylated-DNA--[protein]-cysteine S-methyltransferase n=1 Tax=Desulfovibrio aminophilus TaxID=81425 RepID=UPI00146D1757|nr:methylated-DNA--[protein]-cysteine S-methyltransferase [Desulfovibrio aminophilus]